MWCFINSHVAINPAARTFTVGDSITPIASDCINWLKWLIKGDYWKLTEEDNISIARQKFTYHRSTCVSHVCLQMELSTRCHVAMLNVWVQTGIRQTFVMNINTLSSGIWDSDHVWHWQQNMMCAIVLRKYGDVQISVWHWEKNYLLSTFYQKSVQHWVPREGLIFQ